MPQLSAALCVPDVVWPHAGAEALQAPQLLWPLSWQHDCVLHDCESVLPPEHELPAHEGDGLLHVLDLDCVPPPHDTEHELQLLHALQPPFTGTHAGGATLSVADWDALPPGPVHLTANV